MEYTSVQKITQITLLFRKQIELQQPKAKIFRKNPCFFNELYELVQQKEDELGAKVGQGVSGPDQ